MIGAYFLRTQNICLFQAFQDIFHCKNISFRSIIVLAFCFRSLIHFKLCSVYGVRDNFIFTFISICIFSYSSNAFRKKKKSRFSPLNCFGNFVNICLGVCGSIPGLLILFQWCMSTLLSLPCSLN